MKNFYKIFSLLSLLVSICSVSFGQIQFKIELMNDKDLYQVSLLSEEDLAYPKNIIGTAQVSIKAPILGFEIGEINSLAKGVEWELNSKIVAPNEAKDFQYLSFTLKTAGAPIPLIEQTLTPLFTFINKEGECPGDVSLVDNQTDSFLPPNSRNANIGNQITPFAYANARNKNAYAGNMAGGIAGCGQLTSLETINQALLLDMKLSPNPALHQLNLNIETKNIKEELVIQYWERGGKLLKQETISFPFSKNIKKQMDLRHFVAGSYTIVLTQGNQRVVNHFIKALN